MPRVHPSCGRSSAPLVLVRESTPVDEARTAASPLFATSPFVDLGLLVLRLGSGTSLALLFGFRKAVGLVLFLSKGGSLGSWGLTELVRGLGFPLPALVALVATLNESVVPLLVAAGIATRSLAALVAIDMGIAFYLSLVPLHEEPLRAALYLVMFAGIAIAGPGSHRVRFPGGAPRGKPE